MDAKNMSPKTPGKSMIEKTKEAAKAASYALREVSKVKRLSGYEEKTANILDALVAEVDLLQERVGTLERENKGIAEWRDEWETMKEQRNQLRDEVERMKQEQAKPVGVTGEMPGTQGCFTFAAFKAADVPNGTNLYTAPQGQTELLRQALDALELVQADVNTTPNAYEAQRQAVSAIRQHLDGSLGVAEDIEDGVVRSDAPRG
jgi:DNA repair exonuclease SbcCD ATPase subunit